MKKFLLFLACTAFAADKDFNGRWNFAVDNEARGRAWWLEVSGAGTKEMKARFVGAPGGQMDEVPKIEIVSKELHWHFERAKRQLHYSARLEKDALIGKLEADGKVINTFRAARAPMIRDVDDDRWKRAATMDLFKNLAAWEPTFPGRPMQWHVQDGVLVNEPKASDIRTKEKFWNFELHAEYRYQKGSNSGFGLRGRYEVQIEDSHGRPPDKHSHGALYSRVIPAFDAANPPGEWQSIDIRLVGRSLTVKLNGKTLMEKATVEGPTAMSFDPNEADPGPIALQGDHGIVEFRKLTLTPLIR